MKIHYVAHLTGCLSALALLTTAAAFGQAEDVGVVRLGKASTTSAVETQDQAGIVVLRGQSTDLRSRNAQTSEALERLMTGQWRASLPGDIQQTAGTRGPACADTCDGCDVVDLSDGNRRDRRRDRPHQEVECPSGDSSSFCPHGYYGPGCPVCASSALLHENCFANYLHGQAALHRAHQLNASAGFNAYLKCKFGYFLHDGCGGGGCYPFGHYSIVYPADAATQTYSDARDGMIYAAQGYGGPVSVPLAPNVRHTYNYGWGVPSSRLTPISHQLSVQ